MIFFKSTVAENNTVHFQALENDVLCGECTLDLNGKSALVYSISFDTDKQYIAEGLVKSAFNYAALKNFYMCECRSENISSLLLRLGFQKTENGYISDIPSVLTGSCCKK